MFPGVMALFERSLRVDARAWGPHLARFGLMASIYVAVIVAVEVSFMFGAPGLRFFRTVAYLDLTFMTLLGISFFATAITEEKEEDMLGLMLMAGISPLGILLGKSGGRLMQALLLVAVQYPFTLLAITMGGITQVQLQSTYVALFAYLVMLSGVGLLFSTIAHRSQTAATLLLLTIIAYWGIPIICFRLLRFYSTTTPGVFVDILDWICHSCVFFEMSIVLTTGFGESVFSRQVITNFVIGGLGFLLSWALFGIAVREPSSEANTRGLVTRSNSSRRWLAPGRPGDPLLRQVINRSFRMTPGKNDPFFSQTSNPIAWKDYHFVAGGRAGVLIRLAFFPLLYLICYAVINDVFSGRAILLPLKDVTQLYLTLSMFAISLDLGMLVSRSLHTEIRSQTLAALLLLPISTGRILYAKIGGVMRCWLASAGCFIGGIVLLPSGPECVHDFFFWNNKMQIVAFWLIVHLVLLPHLAAVYAMYVRWGAFPLAIGSTIGCLFLEVSCFQFVRLPQDSPLLLMIALGILLTCGACHIAVQLRAEALGTR